MRFMFYSHDGLGLGHLRRNLAVADALVQRAPEASVLLATGTLEATRFAVPDGVEVLKLPELQKVTNRRYVARRLALPGGEVRNIRASLLAAAVTSFRPGVLLADKHPMGVEGELLLALESHRAAGGRAALGLRDILDKPDVVRDEWRDEGIFKEVTAYYDRVLVYGTRSVFDPVSEYGFPARVARRTRFCGYVVSGEAVAPRVRSNGRAPPRVLATAGGGEDGAPMIASFIEASRGAPWRAVAVSGPMASVHDRARLRREAEACDVEFHEVVPDLVRWFDDADCLVSMGGYNTLIEAAARGLPVLCVPRTSPRAEQLLRATAFAELGLVRVLAPPRANAARMRTGIADVVAHGLGEDNDHADLDLDGAHRAADELIELARARRVRPFRRAAQRMLSTRWKAA